MGIGGIFRGGITVAKAIFAIGGAVRQIKKMEKLEKDLGQVSKYIVVRPRPESYVAQAEGIAESDSKVNRLALLYREELPGIYSTLVYDFPQTRMGIDPERLADWKVDYDHVFKIGMQNIKKEAGDVVPQDYSTKAGTTLKLFSIPHNQCVAAFAFAIEEMDGLVGPRGAIVGIPSVDIIMSYPLHDGPPAPAAIADFADTIRKIHENCKEEPLSPDLYAYRNGKYIRLKVSPEGQISQAPTSRN